uniref:Luciferin 4-monooxygenase n=1 Tax=Phrixothrix hirtus TaxID=94779 RepID=Q9U4U7_PHRHR|nr:Chain A, Red-bioluminescence eliciting luciferase [Phrixothrix hirtus]6ABH_B Chain B, Red-bioluminescence eliciting luciferase [Phrixothrix hirtus]6ABH_C Chain C, Red-bioluminescence eliciting luciferase [Phrixothrix hirtus]6ABH_D Chain D, Red-bioluminescence eliciting luciferase [Phrixothrix hirtus]6ABH_E Chain E, Red-bioluminescence eliciting luciferase [Phrixothrix hirtus]6ABH_F Chain F, Red-bioluminescence eliciting luciferase [Phrixothrix hirtus]6ABH_G Chain G, Red-bioluminescence eli
MEEENIVNGDRPRDLVFPGTAGLQLYQSLYKYSYITDGIIDAHTNEVISYAQIFETSCRLAVSLEKYGLDHNNVVAICSENNIHFFGPLIAALYQGIPMATSNDMYTEREMIGHLNISKPCLMFCSKKSLPFILKVQKHLDFLKKVIVIDSMYDINGVECVFSFVSRYTDHAFDPVKFNPKEFDPLERTALIMTSSGTTGLPKGVVISHRSITIRFVHSSDPIYGTRIAPDTSILAIAPFHHAFGLFTALAYFPVGLKIVMVKKFEGEFFLKTIQNYKIASIVVPPPIMVYLAKSPLVDEYNLSSLTEIACGGSPLGRDIADKVAKRLKVHGILQGYGLTETCSALILSPNDRELKKGAIGTPMPYVQVKVIDINTGKALGPREKGEICFKSQMLMKGYHNNPQATRDALDKDGWLHTGDLGYYDEDRFIYVVDRLKELIKYKGYQVAPAELENLLLQHPNISDAGVIGIPDEFAGQLPSACVVLEPGKTMTEKEVQDYIAELVTTTKHLRGGVVFIDSIPKGPTGKLMRNELRAIFAREQAKSKL